MGATYNITFIRIRGLRGCDAQGIEYRSLRSVQPRQAKSVRIGPGNAGNVEKSLGTFHFWRYNFPFSLVSQPDNSALY